MKTGEIIKTFTAKDDRKVILRTPKSGDLNDLWEFINSLVEERADILRSEKVSIEDEGKWLTGALEQLERDEVFFMVAEINGKVVANSEIRSHKNGYDSHVGVLGIAIREGFREIGIGTEIMNTLIEHARKIGLKVLVLSAFGSNKRAIHVYQKVGFTPTGRIPRKFLRDGKFIDEILMAKFLE
jgi:RimJ/RimL family protein N-acetyltransferase